MHDYFNKFIKLTRASVCFSAKAREEVADENISSSSGLLNALPAAAEAAPAAPAAPAASFFPSPTKSFKSAPKMTTESQPVIAEGSSSARIVNEEQSFSRFDKTIGHPGGEAA